MESRGLRRLREIWHSGVGLLSYRREAWNGAKDGAMEQWESRVAMTARRRARFSLAVFAQPLGAEWGICC